MEIKVLRNFLAIAREENISAAAEFLHLSQPSLSRQMIDLEEELGTTLFLRSNRKITLTEDGVLLRKRAEEISEMIDKTEAELSSSNRNLSGDIYIGSGETDAVRDIIRPAIEIHQEYPEIRFHFFSGNFEIISERLNKGLLDFGVFIEPVNTKEYNCIKLPTQNTWGILMQKKNPLAAHPFITRDEFSRIPLIIPRQSLEDNGISEWLGGNSKDIHVVSTYNLIFNASILVDEGMGCALCHNKLVNTTGNSRLCFRPLHPVLHSNMLFVWKKYQIFSKASEYYLHSLQNLYSVR